jgi:hypothetical protein
MDDELRDIVKDALDHVHYYPPDSTIELITSILSQRNVFVKTRSPDCQEQKSKCEINKLVDNLAKEKYCFTYCGSELCNCINGSLPLNWINE